MSLHHFMRAAKANLYFATTPWTNWLINAWWHHRLTGRYCPRAIYVETTNLCNAHCVMCPHDKLTRPRGHMPWEIFTKIIDDCAPFEGRGLRLFLHKDGEPLMDPLLFRRIEYVKAKLTRSHVHFNTNASLLTDDKIDSILRSPLDSITFSVDGASAETYERLRQGLKYDQVRHNVERFLERRKASGSRIHVTLQMVMCEANRQEVEAYRRQWQGKADRVFIKGMHNFLVQETAFQGGEVGPVQLTRCGMPFHVMLFYSNGDAGLCCWDYDKIMKLGNVAESSVLELYNSAGYRNVRRAMRRMACGELRPCNICSQIYGHDGPMWA